MRKTIVGLTANYKKDKSAWDNALTIGYGKMQQKGSDLGWVKTDDRKVIGVGLTYKFAAFK